MGSIVRHILVAGTIIAAIAGVVAPAGTARTQAAVPCVAGLTCTPKPKCASADTVPAATNLARMRRATLCLLNRQRTKHGLRKLHANRALRGVAQRYARQMVVQSFFDHVSPGGSTFTERIERSTYLDGARGWSLGENLAWGGGALSTPREIVKAWMHSPGHRHNILTRAYRDIGVGITLGVPVAGGGDGATYVNEFGQRTR